MKNKKCKFGERMLIRKKNTEIERKKEKFGKGKKMFGREGQRK